MASVTHILEYGLPLYLPSCFTDSKVELVWIQDVDKEWKLFVQNCVNEIIQPVDCWSHCPGKDNPAHIPSRGLAPLELYPSMCYGEMDLVG